MNPDDKIISNTVASRATIVNILGNLFLFILKIWFALFSGSIALLSDAFNSLTDLASSVAIYISVRISSKEADEGHPFGHSRAEPVAGIIVAVFAGILGIEIVRSSAQRLAHGGWVEVNTYVLLIPVITAVTKIAMAIYFKSVGKRVNSPAIAASSVDSLCDVGVAAAALIGLVGYKFGLHILDPLAGLFISVWIIYTGYKIGMDNIDYLMGKAPGPALTDDIRQAALNVEGVKGVNTIRAHYVGAYIHVEIHVEVPKYLSTFDSHDIGAAVEYAIQDIKAIDKAFVHLDPV